MKYGITAKVEHDALNLHIDRTNGDVLRDTQCKLVRIRGHRSLQVIDDTLDQIGQSHVPSIAINEL